MSEERRGKFRGKVGLDVQNQQQRSKGFGYIKLPEGVLEFKEPISDTILVDMMPYIVVSPGHMDRNDQTGIGIAGSQWYKVPFKTHRNVGIKRQTIVCPTTFGKACPICEMRSAKFQAQVPKEEIKPYYTSNRNLYCVIPQDRGPLFDKVCVWDIADFNFQKQLNEDVKEDEKYEDFPDLEFGYTLRIRFTKKSLGTSGKVTEYGEASRIDFVDRDLYEESVLDEIPNLEECLEIHSYETVMNMWMEQEGDEPPPSREPVAESVEQPPRRRRSAEPVEESPSEPVEQPPRRRRSAEPVEQPPRRRRSAEPVEQPHRASVGEPVTRRTRTAVSKEEPKEVPFKQEDKVAGSCPHGHVFGKDEGVHADCLNCEVWEECVDAKTQQQ